MKLHELKEFTLYYILEHDNLTKVEKLQLGEFVKEANEDQVNYLLLTGRPCGGKDAKDFVEKNSKLIEITPGALQGGAETLATAAGAGAVVGMGVAAITAMAAKLSGEVWRQYLSKAARSCKGFAGLQKKSCMVKFKRQALKKQVTVFASNKSKCSKTKNPKVCARKLDNKIAKLKAKLGEL